MYTFVLVHRIYAMKPNSLVSATVTPDIILCPGCGGHGSCDFEGVLPQPQPSFFLVECVCDPGWTGRDVYTTALLLLGGVCRSPSSWWSVSVTLDGQVGMYTLQLSFFLVECVCDPGWTGRDVYTTALLLLGGVCL